MTVFALRPAFSQKEIRISLLTCSPGTELYSTFGHTAIRVTDSVNDIVFNYGTFDFNDPDFYTKFVKGKLDYFLSIEYFQDFYRAYQFENRSIYEQELNLTLKEKETLFNTLITNAREENKFYKYDFLLNNCTTKAADRILQGAQLNDYLDGKNPTFRDLLHEYLQRPDQQWVRLGIDLLMGVEADKKLDNKTALFLPDYLKKGLTNAKKNDTPVVIKESLLLDSRPIASTKALTPTVFFWTLAIILALVSFTIKNRIIFFLHIFDRIFFFFIGILGAILLFMWIGTDHHAFSNNWNILWAFPTHAVFACLNFNKLWVKKYFNIVFWGYACLIIFSFIIPQAYNESVLPILVILGTRASYLRKQEV